MFENFPIAYNSIGGNMNLSKDELHIFESTIKHGPMSSNPKFYPASWDQEKIKQDLLKRRIQLGKEHGFNGKKIIVPIQKNDQALYPDGKYMMITKQQIENQDDLWDLNLYTDILLLSYEMKGVVIGFPAADCPILIIEDTKNKIVALSHCGAEYINRELPIDTVNSLCLSANTNPKDMKIYISSCATKESYTYDQYPKWATNKSLWQKNIYQTGSLYHIDLRNAIIDLLCKHNITLNQINISLKDTITDPDLYSNNRAHHQEGKKNGRHLIGCFYPEEKEKTYLLFKTKDR